VDIRVFQAKYDQLVSRLRILIGNGLSREEIVTALDISDLNWPLVADRIRAIYDELSE